MRSPGVGANELAAPGAIVTVVGVVAEVGKRQRVAAVGVLEKAVVGGVNRLVLLGRCGPRAGRRTSENRAPSCRRHLSAVCMGAKVCPTSGGLMVTVSRLTGVTSAVVCSQRCSSPPSRSPTLHLRARRFGGQAGVRCRHHRPSPRTCCRSCSAPVRAAIVPARRRRCR